VGTPFFKTAGLTPLCSVVRGLIYNSTTFGKIIDIY